jgi:malonate decarboxylase alpha subunit
MRPWNSARSERDSRLQAGARYARNKRVEAHDATALLEATIRSGDRVCIEGDNQKRLDYSYSGPQAGRIAKLLAGGKIELGGHYPHTGDMP